MAIVFLQLGNGSWESSMKLRTMGYVLVTNMTRLFIIAIFILSGLLAYRIFVPKQNRTMIYLSSAPSAPREIATRDRPGINVKFVSQWVKNFITQLYNFDVNDVNDGKFVDKLKPLLFNPSQFKSNFLQQNWVQQVKLKNLVVNSIIDGTVGSNSTGFLMTKPGEWNVNFPIYSVLSGQGFTSTTLNPVYRVTVTIKQVDARNAPLSGLKVVDVKDERAET